MLSFENLESDGSGDETPDWPSQSEFKARLRFKSGVGDPIPLDEIGDSAVLTNNLRDRLGVAAGLLLPAYSDREASGIFKRLFGWTAH